MTTVRWFLLLLLLFSRTASAQTGNTSSCSNINLSNKIMPPLDQGGTGTCASMTFAQLISFWKSREKIDPLALTFSLSKYSTAKTNSFIRPADGSNSSVMSNLVVEREKPTLCSESIYKNDERYLSGPELAQFASESSGILSSIAIIHKQFQKLPPNHTSSQVKQMVLDLLPALHFPYVENGKIQRFIPSERRKRVINNWCQSKLFPDNAIDGERLCIDFTKTFDSWVNKLHIICGKDVTGEDRYDGDLLCPSKEDLALAISGDLGANVRSPTQSVLDHFKATDNWPMYGVKVKLAPPFSDEVRNRIATAMAPKICVNSTPFPNKIDSFVGAGSTNRPPEKVLDLVNYTLSAGVPLYLTLDICGSLFPEKDCKGKNYHAVTVYGRTMHNGTCGYLIRNSWGTRSNIYDKSPLAKAVEGSAGDFWLSQSAFYKMNQYNATRSLVYYVAAFLSLKKNDSKAAQSYSQTSFSNSISNPAESYDNSKSDAQRSTSPMEY